MALHYLTVQDILWINLQVTKKVHRFSYARLEEATFYQCAYGESNSIVPQAARFLAGFVKMAPIEEGNDATALVAVLTFLRINGQEISLPDEQASAWFEGVRSGRVKAREAIDSIATPGQCGHHLEGSPNIRATVFDVLSTLPTSIASLIGRQPVVA
jgi:death-on-curing protein